jgi:hypothetical protein
MVDQNKMRILCQGPHIHYLQIPPNNSFGHIVLEEYLKFFIQSEARIAHGSNVLSLLGQDK